MTRDEYRVGDAVAARAGRDKGRIFVVVGIPDAQYALISDGDTRKLNKPKRKKWMHLSHVLKRGEGRMEVDFSAVCDADIRKHLLAVSAAMAISKEG